MTKSAQFAVQATYYSLAQVGGSVVLLAKWMEDAETGATIWTEIDREDGNSESAWVAIRKRNMHLLPVPKAA